MVMARRTKITTEYRQTGECGWRQYSGDRVGGEGIGADGVRTGAMVVGMERGIKWWGWIQNILPFHPLRTVAYM